MVRIVVLLLVGAGIAAGVYFVTLPDCKRGGGEHDAALVTSGAAPVASAAH